MLTGLLGTLAVIMGSFWLFCLAAFLGGGYAAPVVLSFRFAAAEAWRPSGAHVRSRSSWGAALRRGLSGHSS